MNWGVANTDGLGGRWGVGTSAGAMGEQHGTEGKALVRGSGMAGRLGRARADG